MSETVHYRGKAIKLEDLYLTTAGIASKILNERGKSNYITGQEIDYLCEEYYKEFFHYGQNLYKLEYESLDADGDIIKAHELADGTIDFELRFYNGGAGFEECLEEAFDEIIK